MIYLQYINNIIPQILSNTSEDEWMLTYTKYRESSSDLHNHITLNHVIIPILHIQTILTIITFVQYRDNWLVIQPLRNISMNV